MSVIGYVSPARYYCRACTPEGLREPHRALGHRPGTHRILCDTCGDELTPCMHEWGAWSAWWSGGEFRSCVRDHCEEIERRGGGSTNG